MRSKCHEAYKLVALLIVSIAFIYSELYAGIPSFNGVWKSSSGNTYQIQEINGGFLYKNLSGNVVLKANFVNVMGLPGFRADLIDGSFNLFVIVSPSEIRVINSYNMDTVNVWKRKNNINVASSQSDNRGSVQPLVNGFGQSSSGGQRQCTVCGGTGNSKSIIDAPNYTGDPVSESFCSICGYSRRPHTHQPCMTCGGTGYR